MLYYSVMENDYRYIALVGKKDAPSFTDLFLKFEMLFKNAMNKN